MAKINDSMRQYINNSTVAQAADNAASFYEQNMRLPTNGNHFRSDVKFSSGDNNPYTALLSAIISYASKPDEKTGLSPEQTYSVNAKDKLASNVSFPQYAVGIKEASRSTQQWKYTPYGLVYPATTPEGMSSATAKALKRTSGTMELIFRASHERNFNSYQKSLKDSLLYTPDTSGSAAANSLNTVLEKRKLVTPDFNTNNEADRQANNFVELVNTRLNNDDEFRKEFFKYAVDNQGSEFEKYLNYCGYNDTTISGYAL